MTYFIYMIAPWIITLWYRLTLFFTRIRSVKIPRYTSVSEILEHLSYGRQWKKDAIGGKLDNMQHPTRVFAKIVAREKIGDCEDHAIYWATALLSNRIATRAWIGIYSAIGERGRIDHAVCLYKNQADAMCWVDYRMPEVIREDGSPTAWAYSSALRMDRTAVVRYTGKTEVRLRERDNPTVSWHWETTKE